MEKENEGLDIEFEEVDEYNYLQLIDAAHNSLAATDGLDLQMMPKKLASKVPEARHKAIELILFAINKLHEEILGGNKL